MKRGLRETPFWAIMKGFMANTYQLLRDKTLHTIALGILCSIGAFGIGIETAGDVHPFAKSQAAIQEMVHNDGTPIHGDTNGNGILDANDVTIILESAQGLETPDSDQIRRGDTDGDFTLTVKDAHWVLHRLSL